MFKRIIRRRRQRWRRDEGESEYEDKEEDEEVDTYICMLKYVNSNINTTSCLIVLANTESCRDGTLQMQ